MDVSFMEGQMDPVSALGLWTLSLLGIGAVVYAAQTEARRQREIGSEGLIDPD
jgi:hypothetical protein